MRRVALAVALGILAPRQRGPADLPTAPEDTRPLLVGETIPGLTLTTVESQPFDLTAAVARRPTVLIYYRGGW